MTPTNHMRSFRLFNFVMLLVIWLLLTNSFTIGNLLLAAILAWFIPSLVGNLQTDTQHVRRPLKALKYLIILFWDILVSSMIVAKQVMGPSHLLRPGFVTVPLELEEPLPITLLASTISLTPGTVSTDLSEDHSVLFVHALHVDNEAELVAEIKQRYEQPLKEIFGC